MRFDLIDSFHDGSPVGFCLESMLVRRRRRRRRSIEPRILNSTIPNLWHISFENSAQIFDKPGFGVLASEEIRIAEHKVL